MILMILIEKNTFILKKKIYFEKKVYFEPLFYRFLNIFTHTQMQMGEKINHTYNYIKIY